VSVFAAADVHPARGEDVEGAGRVGVLRGELEPEERAWLAERLTALVAKSSAIAAESNRELYQGEPDGEGQKQQPESCD